MIAMLLLVVLCICLPAIHYDDIVDEHRKPYHGRSFSWANPIKWIYNRVYGAWMFEDRRLDRLSLVLMHIVSIYLVSVAFGEKTAILWALSAPCVFMAIWRNARRYVTGTLLSLGIYLCPPLGVLMLPLMYFAHIGALPAVLVYLPTEYWMVSLLLAMPTFLYATKFRKSYDAKLSTKPEIYKEISFKKMVIAIKTVGYFVYKTLIPQRAFVYEDWYQQYGSDVRADREVFSTDKWFFGGILSTGLLISALFYEPTRFGAFWFFLFALPFLNITTAHQHNNIRYAALPGIGLCGVVAVFLPIQAVLFLAALHGIYFVLSMEQFQSDVSLYNYHFTYKKTAIAPYVCTARHLIKLNQMKSAREIVEGGLKMNPECYGLLYLKVLCTKDSDERTATANKMKDIMHYQEFADMDQIKSSYKNLETLMRTA